MKPYSQDDLDLRAAFGPVPEDIAQLVLHTAGSVKEERRVRKFPIKALVIAMALILATTSAAVAATAQFGWKDFFSIFHLVDIPQSALDAMSATETLTCQVGPLTLTVQELFCDGIMAMSSVRAQTTDGSPAIYAFEVLGGDSSPGMSGENGEQYAQYLGVAPDTSWTDAAKQLKLPLYQVEAMMEPEPDYHGACTMMEWMWDEGGSMVCFSQPDLQVEAVAGITALPVAFYLRVDEIDPETRQIANTWVAEPTAQVPVNGVLAERIYVPEAPFEPKAGWLLESIRCEVRISGMYVYTQLRMPDEVSEEDLWDMLDSPYMLCNADDEPYAQGGICMSFGIDVSNPPTMIKRDMFSVAELPESLIVHYGDKSVKLK